MGLSMQNWDFVEALVDGHVVEAIFSLCFTEDGGAMTLGTVEAAWAHEPLRYAPYTNGYYVPVHGVEMGGREHLQLLQRAPDAGAAKRRVHRVHGRGVRATV